MDFLKADLLKKEFEVEGSFYNIVINGKVFECRNYAQIYKKDRKTQEKYDALFVLINPGKCMPKLSTYEIPQVTVGQSPINFTLAQTDNTQYQIMRFMKLKQWNKVLLINLSDIRAGNMDDFKKELKDVKKYKFDSHSIFSPKRCPELKRTISKINGPIILAWGTDPSIKKLAEQALQCLPEDRIIGMEHEKEPFYYHASPPPIKGKMRWLEYMNNREIKG
ncbi:DUF1643 domain-containing protein [Ornithinibacillus halotolerans]|uniref:DUF1643 domain-containing protein n=1 Tax=Ornithinibacillus halotolerans TaxID=1274357 RepID=A0A916WEW7_9BACI|nr:DUF1643 domain-containing protein [Ornithinibacillus halotolerans]GGA91764.1 hypothetical protein GCM10008025_37820 [Ornithinibacillus halotolerans]